MKTVLLIRHAKSGWSLLSDKDFDRPLNETGLADAPKMAALLSKKNISIDCFISSTANRAATTCNLFTEVLHANKFHTIFLDKLYHAPPNIFKEVIAEAEDAKNCLAIFAHNPGISEFANTLCQTVRISDMPTCSIFAVSADITTWKDFETAEKSFLFFEKPKGSL
jgi:phosphohistidine phosphatase